MTVEQVEPHPEGEDPALVHASEYFLRAVIDNVYDYAILTLDPAGRVTSWNEGARRLLGYNAEEIINQPLHRFYVPDDVAAGKPDQEMQTALTTGRSEDESWRVRRDGSRFWCNEIVTPLYANDGTHVGFAKISRDLTERKRAEEAIRDSEQRLRIVMDSITDYGIITQDALGTITSWNVGAERVFGFSAEEAVGQPITVIFVPEDRARGVHLQEMEQAEATGRAEDERWHLRKDGSRLFVSGVMVPLQDGGATGFVKVARDLTERRQWEERLEAQVKARTAQVRELVTQLTMSEQEERRRVSAILHDDLQQRLFSLNFQLTFLRQDLAIKGIDITQQVAEIEEALRVAVHITRELSVDLSPPVLHNEGLVEAIHWLASQMAQQHGLVVDLATDGTALLLDEDLRVLLFQTVRELLFNVVKHAQVNLARVMLTYTDGQIQVEVSDGGRGFDPSSNGKRKASQGLERIEQRLQLLGGYMKVVSAPGQGTQITLYVPLQRREHNQ